jgi:hypothetical protein
MFTVRQKMIYCRVVTIVFSIQSQTGNFTVITWQSILEFCINKIQVSIVSIFTTGLK